MRLGHVVAVGSVDEVVHSLHSCSDKSHYQLPGEEEMMMDAETGYRLLFTRRSYGINVEGVRIVLLLMQGPPCDSIRQCLLEY